MGTDTLVSVPDQTPSTGSLRNTLVSLIVVPVDTDTLSLSIPIGIGKAGQTTSKGARVEVVAGETSALSQIVDIAVGGTGSALIVEDSIRRGTDTNSVLFHIVGRTSDGALKDALVLGC